MKLNKSRTFLWSIKIRKKNLAPILSYPKFTSGYLGKVRDKDGFTLMEILVAITIGIVALTLVSATFIVGQNAFRKSDVKSELSQNGRVILDRLGRELRQAVKIVTVLPADKSNPAVVPHEIMFEDGHITSHIQYLKYYLVGTNLKKQIIIYYFLTDPSVYVHWDDKDIFGDSPHQEIMDEKLIGEYANNLDFYGSPEINVDLILVKRNEKIEMTTKIFPRNL